MKKVIVIGCPGGGKSTFSGKLRKKTGLPLHHLDMIWHRADKTHITQEDFDCTLERIMSTSSWIIDGNYRRTLENRIQMCDTVFFLDLPMEVCLEGVRSRIGKVREDMPWIEETLDEEFEEFIIHFSDTERPFIYSLLEKYPDKCVVIFHSRTEMNQYLDQLQTPDLNATGCYTYSC